MTPKIFSNAWVRSIGAEVISAAANDLRSKCGFEDACNLDVAGILRKLQSTELPGKGRLRVSVHADKPQGYSAYVTFKPFELHVEKLTFERARWNTDFRSKYIISHELGHIVLHNHLAVPFSDRDIDLSIRGTEDAQAEAQADCFADYLLLPDQIISRFSTVDQIIKACSVSTGLAERRFAKRKHPNLFRNSYVGEFCPNCQNPKLVRSGLLLQCDACGESCSGL